MVTQEDTSFKIPSRFLHWMGNYGFAFFDGHTWFGHQRAHGTNGDASQTRIAPRLSQRYAGQGGNDSINTPESKIKDASALLMTCPNAFAAYDTLVGIIGEQGMTRIYGHFSGYLSEPLEP